MPIPIGTVLGSHEMVAENPGTFPIVVVLNWLQDLKQRTAVH
jgi:hypothetical protein